MPYVELQGNLLPKWHPIQIHPPMIRSLVALLSLSWWALSLTLATVTEQRFSKTCLAMAKHILQNLMFGLSYCNHFNMGS